MILYIYIYIDKLFSIILNSKYDELGQHFIREVANTIAWSTRIGRVDPHISLNDAFHSKPHKHSQKYPNSLKPINRIYILKNIKKKVNQTNTNSSVYPSPMALDNCVQLGTAAAATAAMCATTPRLKSYPFCYNHHPNTTLTLQRKLPISTSGNKSFSPSTIISTFRKSFSLACRARGAVDDGYSPDSYYIDSSLLLCLWGLQI